MKRRDGRTVIEMHMRVEERIVEEKRPENETDRRRVERPVIEMERREEGRREEACNPDGEERGGVACN